MCHLSGFLSMISGITPSKGFMSPGFVVLNAAERRRLTTDMSECTYGSMHGTGLRSAGTARFFKAGLTLLGFTLSASAATNTIEFVSVGNPGNPADARTGGTSGSVPYVFYIGKYPVRNDQYAEFLNNIAQIDPHSLSYGSSAARGGIIRSGPPGTFSYSLVANYANKPLNWITFYSACRFCNWLHNGGTAGANTEDGAYDMSLIPNVVRKPGAKFFLPTHDEWYKAAWYEPGILSGGTNANYWLYATRNDTAPTPAVLSAIGDIINGPANVANYDGSASWGGYTPNVSSVGSAGAGSVSYWGAYDMNGNVYEWTETAKPADNSKRSYHGGSAFSVVSELQSILNATSPDSGPAGGYWDDPVTAQSPSLGFRIATLSLTNQASLGPNITAQPQSQVADFGGSATFSVGASGTPPLSYQWLFNGSNISGATSSTYTLTNLLSVNSGTYSVNVSNPFGNAVSSNATLLVGGINNAIISWGDNVLVYGNGTDSAFDNPAGIARMMARLKGRGYTGVYMRTDIPQFDPAQIIINTNRVSNPMIALLVQRGVYDVSARFDVTSFMRAAAETNALDYWAYHPDVYSSGAPASTGWPYENKYLHDHPEVVTVDRSGTTVQYLVREYAYDGARADEVQEFVYLANTYGIRNFLPSMRTEAAQLPGQENLPTKADQFGFNQPIVNAMQANYGVNILTDSRFDINNSNFSSTDPMVQNWHHLRGGYLTQFYKDLRAALTNIDPNIRIVAEIPGDYAGPELGNWQLDWRAWITNGSIDELVVPVTLSAGSEPPSANLAKGYLTDVLNNIGVLPISTYRGFINANRPGVKLLNAGQYEAFPVPLVPGTDGWQTFWTLEAFDIAWYQRWQQWKADLNDFGYIRFIEQNFDSFPTNSAANSGAEGDARYVPWLRACPGGWYYLSTASDANQATVQGAIKHGPTGNALRIIRGPSSALFARHLSGYDHSSFQSATDNLIDNGTCSFEFWMFRPDANSSLAAFVDYDASPGYVVGVYVEGGANGSIDYKADVNTWTATGFTMPTNQWTKFTLVINLAAESYSLYQGLNREVTLKANIPYNPPANRFNQLYFSTAGSLGNFTYVDDVSFRWYPAQLYALVGANILLSDSFESHRVDDPVNASAAEQGGAWTAVISGTAQIENKLSFGDGFKCLRVAKNGANAVSAGSATPWSLAANSQFTLDVDVYVRPGYLLQAGLRKSAGGNPTAAIQANGTWRVWSGGVFTDTGVSVQSLWTHVQLALNTSNRTYQVAVQPVGNSAPTVLGTYPWDVGTQTGDAVFFQIDPLGTAGQIVYFDNVLVASGPLVQIAPFKIKSFVLNGNNAVVSFLSVAGQNYSLERSTSLNGGWTSVATVAGTGQVVEVTDPNAGAPLQLFYRLRLL
jgi:formylglycine-generating enzyme required for sulfatase activity